MSKSILKLKIVEWLIYIYSFLIITYDFILPKNIADKIYDFGPIKLTIIVSLILISLYFYLARNEHEYLKEKFSKKRIILSTIVSIGILILYFFIRE